MCLDKPFADGKAKAGPPGPFRDRKPVELFEYSFQVRLGDPRTVVGDFHREFVVQEPGSNFDTTFRRRIFQGIIQEIHQDLGHQCHIHSYRGEV